MHLCGKQALREQYRRERHERSLQDSWQHILGSSEFIGANNIASYLSYGDEPETSDLHSQLLGLGKKLYLPRLLADNDLEWASWQGNNSELRAHGKVKEPTGPAISPEEFAQIEIFIVPALHVDRDGNRLGQGGGSYDRALARSSAWKIALVHYGEITSEKVPVEAHDQPVNAAATPDLLIRFVR